MGCLCCGAEPALGALCRTCALAVRPCDGLIADHLHSTLSAGDAEAWLVDGFGGAHPVARTTRIGRNRDSGLMVLASSVSREHAEIRRTETGWSVHDLGSRNGTFVAGVRVQDRAALPGRAQLKVGDVALWFLPDAGHDSVQRPTTTTAGRQGKLVRYLLEQGNVELCIVVGDDSSGAGALLWRPAGTERWSERGLAPLEFQLLRVLCIRGDAEASSPSPIRGCVPTKQLVSMLPFQSKYANQENVRQVVLRLRGVLSEVGGAGLLAVAPGRGYYLACRIRSNQAAIPTEIPAG